MNIRIEDFVAGRVALGSTVTGLRVPGEHVIAHRLPRPAIARHRWEQVIPWQLAPELPHPIEHYHFAIADDDGVGEQITVLVAERSRVNEWLLLCGDLKQRIRRFVPDYLALPLESSRASVAPSGDRIAVRLSESYGYSISPQWLDTLRAADHPAVMMVANAVDVMPDWRLPVEAGVANPEFRDTGGSFSGASMAAAGMTVLALVLWLVSVLFETRFYGQAAAQMRAHVDALMDRGAAASDVRADAFERALLALERCAGCRPMAFDFQNDEVVVEVDSADGAPRQWRFGYDGGTDAR